MKTYFSNMKIGTRLGLAFGMVLVLLSGVALIGVARLNTLDNAITSAIDFSGNENHLISQALGSAQGAAIAMRNLIILNDVPRMTAEKQAFDQRLARYNDFEKKLNDVFSEDPGKTDEERNFLKQLKVVRDDALPLVEKAATLGLHNDPRGPEVMMSETVPALDRWVALMTQFRDYEINASNAAAAKAHNAYTSSVAWLLALSGIGIATGVVVAWLATRSITVPIGEAVRISETVAARDLTSRVETDRRDEIGQLLQSLKAMNENLADVVSGIRGTTESVTVASQEIASGNTDLSSRTEEQAASLEETASSMTQLTETVKQNADNARQANTLATRATDMADAGNEAVQGMVGTIGRISGSSTKISEITGTIEGIAFQTNILALNAAVEAARAGEQGRGFAVVASEVRGLAQRSAAAAKEIKELIGSSVAMIEDGARQATEVGATMGEVKQAIKQVSDIVGEIAAASEEQSRGIEQVNQAVMQMDEVTQQNAALVEQAAAAAQSLQEQAQSLSGAVSVFRLADTGLSTSQAATAQHRRGISALGVSATRTKGKAAVRLTLGAAGNATVPSDGAAGQTWGTF